MALSTINVCNGKDRSGRALSGLPAHWTPKVKDEGNKKAIARAVGEEHPKAKAVRAVEAVTAAESARSSSRLKRKKKTFKVKVKSKASSVCDLPLCADGKAAVNMLCEANDLIDHYSEQAAGAKATLGKLAKDAWYKGSGDRSYRIADGIAEAVVSVKEKTTGKLVGDIEEVESILGRIDEAYDVNDLFEERSTIKVDTKMLDALEKRDEFIEAMKELAETYGVEAAITEDVSIVPKRAFHTERRENPLLRDYKFDLEEQVPITTSVNTKVKRK